MFYSLLFLTALLSHLQGSSASSQTRSMNGGGNIAALNNLVVIGNPEGGTVSFQGSISFSLYSYALAADKAVANDYAEFLSTGTALNSLNSAAFTDLASNVFEELGHSVAIADSSTVFASQCSTAKQTGRVVVYEGNVTDFKQTQLLIPYDGKHRMDSEAAFGESIAAKPDTLAVGCQNCNTSAPIFSGAVYVYKSNKEGRWSESQVLTAAGVLFMGERVAMHKKVLIAAGDEASGLAKASLHNFGNIANTAVVFEEGPGGKFEQRQVLIVKSGNYRESITGVTVFDETIAITTMGTDDASTSPATTRDKVHIYYPMNKRYGMEQKGKPSPQQWTNIQVLTSATPSDIRYELGFPSTSISMNSLSYVTTNGALVAVASARRLCLSCKFNVPTLVNSALADTITDVLLTSDDTAFYGFQTLTALKIEDPILNSIGDQCLTLELQDQYNDGWGIASLVVTSPTGREDRFTLQCTTANPHIFKYCPESNAAGKYQLRIENGEETPFGWEILWKVQAGGIWYVGDKHTHMDFLWDERYEEFNAGAIKETLPTVATCEVCDPNQPTGKHRSLSNLRALHHKGVTSSPTSTQAPTLAMVADTVWNEFTFSDTSPTAWFSGDYSGAAFFISDKEGKHLHRTGTSCVAVAGIKCWVELPDGDYTVRVGDLTSATSKSYTFCNVEVHANTELEFTVLNQQCYAGLFVTVENTCLQDYHSTYFLNVDLLLGGGAESLSVSDESNLKIATTDTMLSVLGSGPSSIKVGKQEVTSSGLRVSMVLQFASVPDITALDNFAKETSSASSLLKYELIGSQTLAATFLKGEVSSVTIESASTSDAHDFSEVDESAYQTVTDHVWLTASVEQSSSNFNVYARYVAEGAYALVAVAAVLAVSFYAKRAMTKTAVVEEDIKA